MVFLLQIKKEKEIKYTHNARGVYRLEFRNHTDIGMNESRFLFVLDTIVLNLLDEGRRTYSLYRMCAVINDFIGSTEYLLFVQSSDRGLFEAGYFATNIYNALQFILVFLANVPKPTYKRKCQNTLYTRFVKHG